jgi:hypothetical protein
VPTAAKPAATAASFATCFRVEAFGRTDFFAFEGRLAFVVLLLFDLAPARFNLVFDVTRRFDAVFDLARFFALFMILPIRFNLCRLGLNPFIGKQSDGILTPSMARRDLCAFASGQAGQRGRFFTKKPCSSLTGASNAPIVRRTVVVVQLLLPGAVAPIPIAVAREGRCAA